MSTCNYIFTFSPIYEHADMTCSIYFNIKLLSIICLIAIIFCTQENSVYYVCTVNCEFILYADYSVSLVSGKNVNEIETMLGKEWANTLETVHKAIFCMQAKHKVYCLHQFINWNEKLRCIPFWHGRDNIRVKACPHMAKFQC